MTRVRAAFARGSHTELPSSAESRFAAVAAVIAEGARGPDLLFILRAEHPDDPWSGHMAFPGGRVEQGETPASAVRREVLEEVGLDLDRDAAPLGRLSDLAAIGRGRPMGLVIVPFVFELTARTPLITNHEVEEVVWVPLSFLAERSSRSTTAWHHGGAEITLPCYRWQGRVIWGLTFAMVDELLERLEGEE
jgi:8-oxo-dGTP pyrophosphatase MutT (NUDIX family)